jgi:hypothetical protein
MVSFESHYTSQNLSRLWLTVYRRRLLRLRVRHRIAPPSSHTDRHSPVIVAEKMIGVAMYELVRDEAGMCGGKR